MAERPLYRPSAWDEAIAADGAPRAPYGRLLDAFSDADLPALQAQLADLLRDRGVGFNSSAGDEVFHVDPVPRIVEASEWRRLCDGLRQRAAALSEFIVDAYGERRIVAEGRMPEHVIATTEHYERGGGVERGNPAPIIGFDLVRGGDGELVVLEDNTRTPSGFAYAVAARSALTDIGLPVQAPPFVDPLASLPLLERALAATAPPWGATILLSDGPANGAWFEHEDLSRRLEIPLVTPAELRRDGSGLLARVDGDERQVGLVYRRTDEDRLLGEGGEPTALGELLAEPIRDGGLVVFNAFGSGIADDKLVHAYVEEMIRFYLDEEPILHSVRSYDLFDEETRREVLGRIEELVVKPRAGLGGRGVVICAHASAADRVRIAEEIEARPADFIAQETIALSTHPTVAGERLEPRHVDLRAFTIGGELAPALLTRFARERGALVVNSSEGGGAKDTWILR